MPVELQEENGGLVLNVKLAGTLVKEDYAELLAAFQRGVDRYGKMRVLLDMTRFRGWDAGGLWEEVKFDLKHLNDMERLAAIGEKRWQQVLTVFACSMLPSATRYFDASEAEQARAWIAEP